MCKETPFRMTRNGKFYMTQANEKEEKRSGEEGRKRKTQAPRTGISLKIPSLLTEPECHGERAVALMPKASSVFVHLCLIQTLPKTNTHKNSNIDLEGMRKENLT